MGSDLDRNSDEDAAAGAGGRPSGDLGADGALAHLFDEGLDHLERYVGLDQRAADFAHRCIDVGGIERAASAETFEDFAKPVA